MTPRLLMVLILVLGPSTTSAQGRDTNVYRLSDAGVVGPTLVKGVKATYTPQARAARIQGFVRVEAVVLADGKVGDVTVGTSKLWTYPGQPMRNGDRGPLLPPTEAARLGLDKQAIEAAKQWIFKPGTKDGRPAAVRVTIEMSFEPFTRPAR